MKIPHSIKVAAIRFVFTDAIGIIKSHMYVINFLFAYLGLRVTFCLALAQSTFMLTIRSAQSDDITK